MDYREREKILENTQINTMRLLGMSISFMTFLLSLLLSLRQMDYSDVIVIVSVFVLGMTLILSYISIGTQIENSAGEATSLIIILTTLSNLSILITIHLKVYFLLTLAPLVVVGLYLFENKRLRKIFFLNIMTIIILVKLAPLVFPLYLTPIIDDLIP